MRIKYSGWSDKLCYAGGNPMRVGCKYLFRVFVFKNKRCERIAIAAEMTKVEGLFRSFMALRDG
jgi:hypothetical protein